MATVYLAGTITGQSYFGATSWRKYAAERLWKEAGIVTYSPMRGKDYLLGETALKDEYAASLSSPKAITTRDRFDVQRADLVLANLLDTDRVSIGTMIEFGWADAFRKPVVAVMTPTNIHYHAMIREIAGWVVETLDSGIEIVKHILRTAEEAVCSPHN